MRGYSPEPWSWEQEDGGDSSVGLDPTPAVVFFQPDGADPTNICEMLDTVVTLDRAHWALDDYKQKLDEIENSGMVDGYYEYPAGVREMGSPNGNAERIVACVNFCAGKTNAELAALGSLLAVIQKHNDFVEGHIQPK